MRPLILLITLASGILLCSLLIPHDKYIPLGEALQKKMVQAEVKAKGGHKGECVRIKIKNTLSDSIHVFLEPGRMLIPDDSSLQYLLIARRNDFDLGPGESSTINGFAFCCRSAFSSPYPDAGFNIGRLASPPLVRLAEIISKDKFPENALQYAVWVISDDHPLSSISGENNDPAVKRLRETVAGIKGVEVPWYTTFYERDSVALFSNRCAMLKARIDYGVRNNAIISITLRDPQGALIKTLMNEQPHNPGEFSFELELNVRGWPKGQYSIGVYADYSNLLVLKKFNL